MKRCWLTAAALLASLTAFAQKEEKPQTGWTFMTLPILSYGGSSLLAVMLTFGIAFSAARPDEPDRVDSVPQTAGGQPHTDPARPLPK